MKNNFIISPSILSADFAYLGDEIKNVIEAGADWIHFDVMDNHYVPNLSFGSMILNSIKPITKNIPIDVHLMVSPVDNLALDFIKAGANLISFHPEASTHIHRSIQNIKNNGCKVGLAFNPASSLDILDYVIDDLDLILIMSVNPGFGGQKFIESSLKKLEIARKKIDLCGKNIHLEVDGGINLLNIKKVAESGANVFVLGNAIFSSESYQETILELRFNLERKD